MYDRKCLLRFFCFFCSDVCPKKTCDMWCPGGYEYDVNGCMMCKCKPDYCQTVKCKWPTECTKPVYVPGKCCPHCSTVGECATGGTHTCTHAQ